MTRKTQDEIKAEIAKLKEVRPLLAKMRPVSTFGDNNLAALDAQVVVLEQDLSEEGIYDKWNGIDEYYVCEEALFAREWIDGTTFVGDGDPAEGWNHVCGAFQ